MAIPKFYSILRAQWPDITHELTEDLKCDYLYLDMNSVLHLCLSESISKMNFFSKVGAYIERLVKLSNPQKLLYLAFDGVPPLAKLKGQAERRRLCPSKSSSAELDPNGLTPGTTLMIEVSNYILDLLKGTISEVIELIISDSSVPGEGEHKIIRHLRSNLKKSKDAKCVIYGTDADFIVLSLSIFDSEINLIRESLSSRKGSTDEIDLETLNMPTLKEKLLIEYPKKLQQKLGTDHILLDVLLVLSIIGNDFLPTPRGLAVDSSSLKVLLKTLREYHIESQIYILNKDGSLEKDAFQGLFSMLTNYDLEKFMKDNPLKRSVLDSKILGLELSGLSLKDRKVKISDEAKEIEVHYFNESRAKIYTKSFSIKPSEHHHFFQQYIRGLQWLLRYYIDECVSWNWMNEYQISPYLSDLSNGFEGCDLVFESGKPIAPLHQLALVLPPRSKALLPKLYQVCELYSDFSSILGTPKRIVKYSEIEKYVMHFDRNIDPYLSKDEAIRNCLAKEKVLALNQ